MFISPLPLYFLHILSFTKSMLSGTYSRSLINSLLHHTEVEVFVVSASPLSPKEYLFPSEWLSHPLFRHHVVTVTKEKWYRHDILPLSLPLAPSPLAPLSLSLPPLPPPLPSSPLFSPFSFCFLFSLFSLTYNSTYQFNLGRVCERI